MIWAQAHFERGVTIRMMICLAGSIIMAILAFALGWIFGRWHQAKRGLATQETEITDLNPEEENQTELKEELEASPPCLVRKEASLMDVERTLLVSRKGTRVHYFSHCSGLASADKTCLERMQFCKFCQKMMLNMNPETVTSCEQPGSSTDSSMQEKCIRRR